MRKAEYQKTDLYWALEIENRYEEDKGERQNGMLI